jgi:hypothetical protein
MTDHTWGVDKSHFDSPTGTAQIVAEGFGFMTHKAGGDSPDSELATWWNDAKGHRSDLLLGAYWVLYPGRGASAGDAFVARLDSQCPGWRDGPFILQLDCEIWGGDTSTQPGLGDIRACALRLRQLAPRLVPIVYAPKWAYGNSLSGLGFPLWSSAYTTATGSASAIYPGDSYSGWNAYSGIVPTIAQFSSTATVAGDNTTDVNAFKGTRAQLQALLAPGWEKDVELTDVVYTAQAGNAGNITPGPRTVGDILGAMDGRTGYLANSLVPSINSTVNTIKSIVTAIQGAPAPTATVDVQALAAALNPLIEGIDITPQLVEQALSQMTFSAAVNPGPAGNQIPAIDTPRSDTPIHDETDALTRKAREDRQGGIR